MASWTKEKAAAFLSESRWLAAQPADFRTALFAHGKLLKLAKGAIVYEQGEFPPKGFYGLLEGRLRASYHHADGETLLLWTMGPRRLGRRGGAHVVADAGGASEAEFHVACRRRPEPGGLRAHPNGRFSSSRG